MSKSSENAFELKEFREVLNNTIPYKKVDKNLLIGTWNIRNFGNYTNKEESTQGDSPKRDKLSVRYIAEVVRKFDITAIQEVKSNLSAFRLMMDLLGPDWAFILNDVNQGKVGNNERMAFVYDTRRVKLSGLACELVIPDEWFGEDSKTVLSRQFFRTPYAVGFECRSKSFVLVTTHIQYSRKWRERIPELRSFAQYLKTWRNQKDAFESKIIALGDFNIEKRGGLLEETFLSEGLCIPDGLKNPKALRSIFDKTKFYDQIAWFHEDDFRCVWSGYFDFVGSAMPNRNLSKRDLSWMISDHYPLGVEFNLQ